MGQVEPAKCENGHLYNPDKHSFCPHCRNPQRQETRTVVHDSADPLDDDDRFPVQDEKQVSETVTHTPGGSATMVDTEFDRFKTVVETGKDDDATVVGGAEETVADDQGGGGRSTVVLTDMPSPSSDTPTDLAEIAAKAHKQAAPQRGAKPKGGLTRIFGEEEPEEPLVRPILGWLVIWEGKPQYHVFRIKEEQTLIGKSSECDLIFTDDFISSEHASIRYRDNKFILTDLDSSNGTFVNDREHKNSIDRVELNDDDEIIVGDTVLKFKCVLY